MSEPKFSIIIPIGPSERAWIELLRDLSQIKSSIEIIIAATSAAAEDDLLAQTFNAVHPVSWIGDCPLGRAEQMNHDAKFARGSWFCFFHADSRIDPPAFAELETKLTQENSKHLHYFDLRFHTRTIPLLRLTELGVRFRCATWGMPYGDQGFVIHRKDFFRLNGYPEIKSGEDHAFAWICKNEGIRPKALGATIYTSPRKYLDNGWSATAFKYNFLGLKQALKFRSLRAENFYKKR